MRVEVSHANRKRFIVLALALSRCILISTYFRTVYESKLAEGRELAIKEMSEKGQKLGANAIIGVDLDFETIREGMIIVIATGTAVRVR